MNNHELKTINPHFKNLWCGVKKFEIRKNDRDFKEGDVLILKEYEPESDTYTGRFLKCRITHVLADDDYPMGLKEGYCILSLRIFTGCNHET